MNNIDVYVGFCTQHVKSHLIKNQCVHIAGLHIEFKISLATHDINPGQLIIVAKMCNQISVYVLDSINQPYQVSGTKDLLLDADSYVNLTQDYLLTIHNLKNIFRHIYNALSLHDLEKNIQLKQWERSVKTHCLNNKLNFDEILEYVQETLNDSIISDTLLLNNTQQILNSIIISDEIKAIAISWGDYF